jgi:uncharacterized protein (TIGR00299 family) protein
MVIYPPKRRYALKIAYFDCSSGISGDMCLGALIHLGAPLDEIKKQLRKIPIRGYKLQEKTVRMGGIMATKADIEINYKEEHIRRWKDIDAIIRGSALDKEIKEKGLKIFKDIFVAEARVHGEPYDRIYLHELGSIDTIIDITGTLICMRILGIGKVFSSPVNLGSGEVISEHGLLPVPAPATAELLRGIPVYSTQIPCELTTPTGAAILKGISSSFGDMPLMEIEKTGIGAGSRKLKERPNILRVFMGEEHGSPSRNDITVIETNIDDMNPQAYEYIMEMLIAEGALDVFLTQVLMKKGRPGALLTVLSKEEDRGKLSGIILKETTTLGLRYYTAKRTTLERRIEKIKTEFGAVRFKIAEIGGKIIKMNPEYEDCKRIAKKTGEPLMDVMRKLNRYTKEGP